MASVAVRNRVERYVWHAEVDEGSRREEVDEQEFGMRSTKKMQDPTLPSQEEVDEHNKAHLPFRSWCRHCVRGRGREASHQRTKEKPGMSEVHFDFFFMGKEGQPGRTIPIAAVKERLTGMLMASVVPTKTTGTFIAQRVMAFLQEVGCEFGDLTVKSDQEEAIKGVVRDVGRLRAASGGGRYVEECSPVGASASNGVVERGIQSIEGQVRVLLDALESRWKVKIPVDHPVICYIIEYAAFVINRFEVGHDGKTNFERCKGKKAKTLGIEFGEAVHWKRKPIGGALGKLSVMWEDGVYLGIKGKSGEVIVATKTGIWKARTVQRKPMSERWTPGSVDEVRHVPWRTSDNDPEVDGERPRVIRLTPEEEEVEREVMSRAVPRRANISKEDLVEHGYTARCPGCLAILRGTARQGHSDECRKRMEAALEGTEKMTEAKEKSRNSRERQPKG